MPHISKYIEVQLHYGIYYAYIFHERCDLYMDNCLFSIFTNDLFIDLTLYQYGWEACTPLHSFGPAARNHYLFHYIISGKGILTSDDIHGNVHTYQLGPGQGFLITPGTINTYYADEKDPWEYAWLEFDGLKVKEFLATVGLSALKPTYKTRSLELAELVKNEMLYIANHSNESSFNLIGHLYLFLDALQKASVTPTIVKGERLRDFYVRESISFIEQHYANDISIQDIADWCRLNRTYFGKIFKETLGTTPQEFLIQYRMTKATEQLKLTENSINDISLSVGYPNQLHFSRAFKKVYGVSPRDWRIQNKTTIHTSSEIQSISLPKDARSVRLCYGRFFDINYLIHLSFLGHSTFQLYKIYIYCVYSFYFLHIMLFSFKQVDFNCMKTI